MCRLSRSSPRGSVTGLSAALPPTVQGIFAVRSSVAGAGTCDLQCWRVHLPRLRVPGCVLAGLPGCDGPHHRHFSRVLALGAQVIVALAVGRLQLSEADRRCWSLAVPQGCCSNLLPHFASHHSAMHRGAMITCGSTQLLPLHGSHMGDIIHGRRLLGANVS